ncbi:3-deoxy-manno-octulosonate cytidylyltransferase [Pedobacter sp. PWIIR3]
MRIVGIIPSRFASTRFPGKPLVKIHGKSMIRRVYEQASSAISLTDVIVATDDERIAEEVNHFGGKFVMTNSNHVSGTDRCAEVISNMSGIDAVINIQGDEPYIDPEQIDLLASCFEDQFVKLATLIKKINIPADLFNPNIPKVVVNSKMEAIYFSRQTIPYLRNLAPEEWLLNSDFYKHIGIYGYTVEALKEITKLAPSKLESVENLEQLRWIENGYHIQTRITELETIAIDTPEDLKKINEIL